MARVDRSTTPELLASIWKSSEETAIQKDTLAILH